MQAVASIPDLPAPALQAVLQQLDPSDTGHCRLVNRSWREAVSSAAPALSLCLSASTQKQDIYQWLSKAARFRRVPRICLTICGNIPLELFEHALDALVHLGSIRELSLRCASSRGQNNRSGAAIIPSWRPLARLSQTLVKLEQHGVAVEKPLVKDLAPFASSLKSLTLTGCAPLNGWTSSTALELLTGLPSALPLLTHLSLHLPPITTTPMSETEYSALLEFLCFHPPFSFSSSSSSNSGSAYVPFPHQPWAEQQQQQQQLLAITLAALISACSLPALQDLTISGLPDIWSFERTPTPTPTSTPTSPSSPRSPRPPPLQTLHHMGHTLLSHLPHLSKLTLSVSSGLLMSWTADQQQQQYQQPKQHHQHQHQQQQQQHHGAPLPPCANIPLLAARTTATTAAEAAAAARGPAYVKPSHTGDDMPSEAAAPAAAAAAAMLPPDHVELALHAACLDPTSRLPQHQQQQLQAPAATCAQAVLATATTTTSSRNSSNIRNSNSSSSHLVSSMLQHLSHYTPTPSHLLPHIHSLKLTIASSHTPGLGPLLHHLTHLSDLRVTVMATSANPCDLEQLMEAVAAAAELRSLSIIPGLGPVAMTEGVLRPLLAPAAAAAAAAGGGGGGLGGRLRRLRLVANFTGNTSPKGNGRTLAATATAAAAAGETAAAGGSSGWLMLEELGGLEHLAVHQLGGELLQLPVGCLPAQLKSLELKRVLLLRGETRAAAAEGGAAGGGGGAGGNLQKAAVEAGAAAAGAGLKAAAVGGAAAGRRRGVSGPRAAAGGITDTAAVTAAAAAAPGVCSLTTCHLVDCVVPAPELLPGQALQQLSLVNTQLPGGLTRAAAAAAAAWPHLRKLQLYLGRGELWEGAGATKRPPGALVGDDGGGRGTQGGSGAQSSALVGKGLASQNPATAAAASAVSTKATTTWCDSSNGSSSGSGSGSSSSSGSGRCGKSVKDTALPPAPKPARHNNNINNSSSSTSSPAGVGRGSSSSSSSSSGSLLPLLASSFPRLQVLEVQQLPGLDDQGLAAVLRLPYLRQLYITSSHHYQGECREVGSLLRGGREAAWGVAALATPPAPAAAAAEGSAGAVTMSMRPSEGKATEDTGVSCGAWAGTGWRAGFNSSSSRCTGSSCGGGGSNGGGQVTAGAPLAGSSMLREVVLQLPGHVPCAVAALLLPQQQAVQPQPPSCSALDHGCSSSSGSGCSSSAAATAGAAGPTALPGSGGDAVPGAAGALSAGAADTLSAGAAGALSAGTAGALSAGAAGALSAGAAGALSAGAADGGGGLHGLSSTHMCRRDQQAFTDGDSRDEAAVGRKGQGLVSGGTLTGSGSGSGDSTAPASESQALLISCSRETDYQVTRLPTSPNGHPLTAAAQLEAALQRALPWACVRAVANQWPSGGLKGC